MIRFPAGWFLGVLKDIDIFGPDSDPRERFLEFEILLQMFESRAELLIAKIVEKERD